MGSGKVLGNTFGVLGLYFSSFESLFMYATREYYFIPENTNTVAAGIVYFNIKKNNNINNNNTVKINNSFSWN